MFLLIISSSQNMKSIAVFNNKGGVGKTTLLCNLAAYLSQKCNKRILIVDADPQCNASIYLMGEDYISNVFSDQSTSTIYKLMQSVRRGKGFIIESEIPIVKSVGFKVDVVVGDTQMSVVEDFLSKEWIDSVNGDPRALKSTFVISDMLYKLEEKYDYIFFDVGPSLGALNRVVLFACDYFIMPMSSDIFSVKAIDNISITLKNWKEELEEGLKKYHRKEGEPFILNGVEGTISISFIGYVHQQYTAKMLSGERRPVRAYDRIIKQMPQRINKKFSDFFPNTIDKNVLKLGDIPNYNSLIPLSQLAHKPIFSLTGKEGVVGAHFAKLHEYENVIELISRNLINNIQSYDRLA